MNGDRGREAGFTLIELIVSLALFALISVAGVALIDSILRIQARTSGRLERLGDIQRAMFVVANDLGQVATGRIAGTPVALSFNRRLTGLNREPQPVVYVVTNGAMERDIASIGRQRLLDGVETVGWHYFEAGNGWIDHWPPGPNQADQWPTAISLDLALKPVTGQPRGTLRRVILLPAQS